MSSRDYARKSSRKKGKTNNKFLWLSIALAVVIAFVGGLFLLKEKSPPPNENKNLEQAEKTQPKSQLPSRPEEVWSYIKDLETREIPVDDNQKSLEKNMQLTEEQKKILITMENEKKQAEIAKAKEEERRKAEASNPKASETKAPETKVVESKPAKVVETTKAESAKPEVKKAEPKPESKAETAKAEPVKKAESTSAGKFGLQCGVFKNQQNAENLQARLAMSGLNARVNTSGEWNRVVVGPVGDRAAASKAQEQAKSVINCVIIGM